VRLAPSVEVAVRSGRAHYHGLLRCGSVWECPTCGAAIRAERAKEVDAVVAWHRASGGSVYLLSLTVSHGLGDELKRMRAGVAYAWKRFQAGEPWKRFRTRHGMRGSVRALEVTVGPNGFHPHIHALLLLRPLSALEVSHARTFFSERWRRVVVATLGVDAAPNDVNGADLRPCAKANYLTKLGLGIELTAPVGKSGRFANRSPLQVATDFANTGDEADAHLWQVYCAGMRGARMLTWTPRLRAAAGLGGERTDAEIVAGEDAVEEIVFSISGDQWRKIRDSVGLLCGILEAAERGGAIAVGAIIRNALENPP
jgi:hypothetical protein